MSAEATIHTRRLRQIWLGFLAFIVLYSASAMAIKPTMTFPTQAPHLLWALSFVAVLNFVTLMPIYRAMMVGPRRVYAVSHQSAPLLRAHLVAHTVALARIEAVGLLGLVLYIAAGDTAWFWVFNGTAIIALAVLWPRGEKVDSLLASTLTPPPAS
jgi:hypothetical protein